MPHKMNAPVSSIRGKITPASRGLLLLIICG